MEPDDAAAGRAQAGDRTGIGYSYAHPAAAEVVNGKLAGIVCGRDPLAAGRAWAAMWHAVRNIGQTGLVSMAISAVDIALWDLKARLLDRPLVDVLDAMHDTTPVYGSGGFCNYTDRQLAEQLTGWVEAGIPRVKMKTGADPAATASGSQAAREAIGDDVELFVDANGAFSRAEALRLGGRYAEFGVRWYEEPVSSDDLAGLHLVRDRAPGGMTWPPASTAGTCPTSSACSTPGPSTACRPTSPAAAASPGSCAWPRCATPARWTLSAHCAPQLSAHACAAVWHLRHLEYFHDHNRIEHLAFDGCLEPEAGGVLRPDRTRPGLGLEVRWPDLERCRVR